MMRPLDASAGQARYACGRWHNGNPVRRWWDRLHHRKSVYVCQLRRDHGFRTLRKATTRWVDAMIWTPKDPKKASSPYKKDFYWKKQRVEVPVRSIEWGHRYELNRVESL